MQRIVVRGVNWLGDAVMTLPALYRLREAHPAAHIALVTPPKLAELYACQPIIDAVIALPSDEPLSHSARILRAGRYDTALIFPHSLRKALPFWMAGVPCRVGFAGRGRTWLLTEAVRPDFAIKIRRRSEWEIRRLISELARHEDAAPPPGIRAPQHVRLRRTPSIISTTI